MKLPGEGTVIVEMSCRFKSPAFIGDTLTAKATVAENIEEKRWVRMALTWTNQRGDTVAEGSALVIPPKRGH